MPSPSPRAQPGPSAGHQPAPHPRRRPRAPPGKKLAILGFAYKKNTSDVRFTASIDVCRALLAERASLTIHDPRVSKEAMQVALTTEGGETAQIDVVDDPYAACAGAHAIIVLTEWDQVMCMACSNMHPLHACTCASG